jgi:hypothetical protein
MLTFDDLIINVNTVRGHRKKFQPGGSIRNYINRSILFQTRNYPKRSRLFISIVTHTFTHKFSTKKLSQKSRMLLHLLFLGNFFTKSETEFSAFGRNDTTHGRWTAVENSHATPSPRSYLLEDLHHTIKMKIL